MKTKLAKGFAILMIAVVMSSCYGSFRLTSNLHAWNGSVSNSKFANELVFLGLCIIPAYEICALGDALIFNAIEFWGGDNPIAMKEGEKKEIEMNHKGETYKVITTKNNMTIALKDSDEEVNFRYFPEENQWYQMNGDEKMLAVK